jgi:hypothetical protein
MDEKAILSTVDNLQRAFTIVLALSLGEAFKQFVADKAVKPEDRTIHWDRLIALIAFLLLLFPFYQGMDRYFYNVYRTQSRPSPYSLYLAIDCLMFTLESSLLFVMSRALPLVQWRRFYIAVLIILSADAIWGTIAWLTHTPSISRWVVLDLVSIPVFFVILLVFRLPTSRWGPALSLIVMLIRTIIDYWMYWDFYFPS